jgi:hypothetical protein
MLLGATPAWAQAPSDQGLPERADPDARVDPLQPDFALAALPTTLRMPRGKWAFRVTHRFTRPLGQGSFDDLLGDAFGLDGGAQIGLEVRFGLLSGTQVGLHRTSDRTIQIFGQHTLLNDRDHPFALDAWATLEGANNLRERHQSTLGVVASRKFGRYAVLYAEPLVALNSSPFATGDEHSLLLGLGGRLRVLPTVYILGEITPRLAGFDPGAHQVSFGIEKRAGGHLFQLSFSNGFGTTFGQVARGGFTYDDWYLGFNIARKFF